MKLISEFLSRIEMSYTRQQSRRKINDLRDQFIKHVYKLMAFDNPRDIGGHLRSLTTWARLLNKATKLTGNSKLPYNDFYGSLWNYDFSTDEYSLDQLSDDLDVIFFNYVDREYTSVPRLIENSAEFVSIFSEVISKLSKYIYNNQSPNSIDIKKIIQDGISQYSNYKL